METFKNLKEMTIKEWDGVPFDAYYTGCNDCAEVDGSFIKVVGFSHGKWIGECGGEWKHVYPVEWNKTKVEETLKPKRMTNRQLAKWLAEGNGQILFASITDLSIELGATTRVSHPYDLCYDADECSNRVRVRKWNSEEWIEPTVDLLEDY